MSTRTLTINHANGSSETYNIKTEDVLGVRSMQVDGETVTIDRTAPANIRSIIADGETITINTTREGIRTLIVDGETITIDRTEEANLESFIEQYVTPELAISLRDLASTSGNTTVIRARRGDNNLEADFTANEVADGTLVAWGGAGNDVFVPIIYDQSSNLKHVTQTDPLKQRKIVDAGVLVTEGGLPAIQGNIHNMVIPAVTLTGDFTCMLLANIGFNHAILGSTGGSPRFRFVQSAKFELTDGSANEINFTPTTASASLSFDGTRKLVAIYRNSSGATTLNINSEDTLDSPLSGMSGTATFSRLFARQSTQDPFTGNFQELVLWNRDIRND